MFLKQSYPILWSFILLLVPLGIPTTGYTQIVIHESDSSWMNEEIPSKALGAKEFTFNRRWYQNLVTRYNFYFNARHSLNETIARAKDLHHDNYDSLLSISSYLPSDFELLKTRLDSVVINAGIGIETHDPRAKWIGDLYLLVGKANYYLQDYEEAVKTFKYMIKNLGEKDEMGNPAVVGSKTNNSLKGVTLMTPEKKKERHPPARNDAFIWLIHSYLRLKDYDQATALMSTVEHDPQLPRRLQKRLYILRAKYALEKEQPDSAQIALQSAIALQKNKKLKARWQFVLSQLYEQQHLWDQAIAGYKGVKRYSPSPIMKFYSRLYQIRARMLQNPSQFSSMSQLMLDMAGKERYHRYRSIIYYQLGKLAIQSGYPEEGIVFLKKSLLFDTKDKKDHFLAYRLLGAHFYDENQYRQAKNYYDSAAQLQTNPDSAVLLRQEDLKNIVLNMDIIAREDSLQKLAKLPKDTLTAFLGEIVSDSIRSYKKQNLILEGDAEDEFDPLGQNRREKTTARQKDERNKWYFYNQPSKSSGYTAFKAKWGKRPLEDNWRLSQPNQVVSSDQEVPSKPILATLSGKGETKEKAEALLQKLLQPIPQTQEALLESNQRKITARHQMINTFFLQLKDDSATLSAIQEMLKYHPDNPYLPDIYYKLYLIYSRIPDSTKANHYKTILQNQYPNSSFAKSVEGRPENASDKTLENTINNLYNTAYTGYLAGDYEQISTLRDSALYLDPQNKQKERFELLHAMSLLKNNADSSAKIALTQLIKSKPADTSVLQRAELLLRKLEHKHELVTRLKRLQLPADTLLATTHPTPENPRQDPVVNPPAPENLQKEEKKNPFKIDSVSLKTPNGQKSQVSDSVAQEKEEKPALRYTLERETPHFVILSFKKINGELIKQTQKAFSDFNHKSHAADSIQVSSYVLAHNRVILIFRLFNNEKSALLYYKEIKEKSTESIIPEIRPAAYQLFFISRNNFILLNNSGDLNAYITFFHKHFK